MVLVEAASMVVARLYVKVDARYAWLDGCVSCLKYLPQASCAKAESTIWLRKGRMS